LQVLNIKAFSFKIQHTYFRQKGGECIDPLAPNFDWKYWNFDICYLLVKCTARPGKRCFCCGWKKNGDNPVEGAITPEEVMELAKSEMNLA
jgi:hypothetical protein